MRMPAAKRAFTLVEVLASIAAFTIVFLAGFGGIGKLLLTQDQNYGRTLAASAAVLIADWHHRSQMHNHAVSDFTKDITDSTLNTATATASDTTHLLVQIPFANVANISWHGNDFLTNPGNKPGATDLFYVFNDSPTDPDAQIHNLANPAANIFTPTEYQMLLVCMSPQSSQESDSKLKFRQISFWYGPPQIIKNLRAGAQTITLELVGRFVIADTYGP